MQHTSFKVQTEKLIEKKSENLAYKLMKMITCALIMNNNKEFACQEEMENSCFRV